MPSRQPGGQLRSCQLDNIAVMQQAIHLGSGVAGCRALHPSGVGFHDHDAGTRFLLNLPHGSGVVVVGVADKNDFGVAILEAQLVDALPNQRDILGKTRVDQDVSFRGFDEINSKICRADVIEIASDFEPRKFAMPVGILSGGEWAVKGEQQRSKVQDSFHY